MTLRRSGYFFLAFLCVAALTLLVFELLENLKLRRELAGESAKLHRLESIASAHIVPHASVAPAETKLDRATIESNILKILHERLWRKDGEAKKAILQRIDPKDLAYALEIVDQNAMGQARRVMRIELLSLWAKNDPGAAASWLDAFPSNEALRAEKELVGEIWSQKDPKAALAFAGPTPAIIHNLTRIDPNEAATVALAAFANRSDRGSAIEAVSSTWFESDPGAALKWAMALPDENSRFFGIRPLLGQLAAVDPASVASYVANFPASQRYLQLEESFSRQWAESDPASASAWATSLPSASPMRADSMIQIAREWADDDPKGAAAWIESLPQGADRDNATQSFVYGSLTYDPAIAARFAETIANTDQRNDALTAVAIRWLFADPSAAAVWMKQIDFPEEIRQKIRTQYPDISGYLPMRP